MQKSTFNIKRSCISQNLQDPSANPGVANYNYLASDRQNFIDTP